MGLCVVGSGAGGGMAAKVPAEAGAEVVLLEAGPSWDVGKDGAMFAWNHDSPRRGKGHRGRPFDAGAPLDYFLPGDSREAIGHAEQVIEFVQHRLS